MPILYKNEDDETIKFETIKVNGWVVMASKSSYVLYFVVMVLFHVNESNILIFSLFCYLSLPSFISRRFLYEK